jgi:L-amino acid N-acyltransferase YncA
LKRRSTLRVRDAVNHEAVRLRRAVRADLPSITKIYNEAILTTTATFDTKPQTVRQGAAWFRKHGKRHPIIVAEVDGAVIGWACLSPWSDREAYKITGETSFYVYSKFRGRGIGRKLKRSIIAEARRLGFRSLIARVADGSDASLHLNEATGFEHIGTLKQVGRKFGRLLDVHILQKMLR